MYIFDINLCKFLINRSLLRLALLYDDAYKKGKGVSSMRRRKWLALLLAVAMVMSYTPLAFAAEGESGSDISDKYAAEGYSLVFNDEFEGDSLNLNDWNIEAHAPGWVNQELQRYVGPDDYENNIKVEDGVLKILPTAEKKESPGPSGNLLKNADFSAGKDGWTETIANWDASVHADASSTTGGGAITYDIKDPGDDDWNVQLKQSGLNLKGVEYKASFDITSTVTRNFKTGVMSTDYNWYGGADTEITAGKVNPIEFTFTATDPAADFYISLGKFSADDDTPASVVTISNLVIERTDGQADDDEGSGSVSDYAIASGRINTQGKHDFTYGRYEARVKVPTGKGYLPAFWLMASDEGLYGQWPRCGEMDIMEVMGQNTAQSYHTIHYGYNSGAGHRENQGRKVLSGETYADDYHVFRIDWDPGKLTWFVDGEEVYTTSDWFTGKDASSELTYPAPFDQDFYVILNLAVGGSWVGYPDMAVIEDMPNQSYDVDYVRVYQRSAEEYAAEEAAAVRPEPEPVTYREPDENGNYVINGDFGKDIDPEDPSENFILHIESDAAGTTYERSDNAITINPAAAGSLDYSVQLKQERVPMFRGWEYELTFDAYAAEERNIKIDVSGPDNSWTRYLPDTDVTLGTEKQTYTYRFTMDSKTDANGCLEFNMGNQGSDAAVTISNVSIKHVSGEEIPEDTSKQVAADGNYVYNGTFDQGDGRLGYWEIADEDKAAVSVTNVKNQRELCVKVEVPEGASAADPVVVSQGELAPFGKGEFAFSFDAYTPDGAADGMKAVISGKEFVPELTASSKSYSFKVAFDTDVDRAGSNVAFEFVKPGTYYLDNVAVREDAMIKNGSFDSGLAGYETGAYNGGSATFGVDSITAGNDNALDVDFQSVGTEDWHVQVKQGGITLEKDKSYKLVFDGRSTIDRTISVVMQRDGNNWSGGGDVWFVYSGPNNVALSSEWQTYELNFTMTEDTDPNSLLSISLGKFDDVEPDTPHHVYLDNFSLTEIKGSDDEQTSIDGAEVVLSKTAFTYNGKVQKPAIVMIGGKTLEEGKDFTASWSNGSSKNAGTYTVTVTGKGSFSGKATATYKINKAANTLKVAGKTASVKYKKLKKKSQTVSAGKAYKFSSKGQGTKKYTLSSAKKGSKSFKKYFKVNSKTGKITVKKGLKKGTYKVKVKVKAAGSANYNAGTKTVTVKIKVK